MAEGIQQFRLPDAGEGLTEAEVLRWTVQPGEEVSVNQIIVEVETAKAVVELPSPYAGTVHELLVSEGATVEVGTPIIAIATGDAGDAAGTGDTEADEAADAGAATAAESSGEGRTVLVGYGVKEGATRRRPRRRTAGAAGGDGASAGAATVLTKPPVRKLAKDLGVDLTGVTPTGSGGLITRDDVRRSAAGATNGAEAQAPPATAEPDEKDEPKRDTDGDETAAAEEETPAAGRREERIPIRGVRKRTAAAMVSSAFTAPHVTEFLQVDVTETMEAVRRLGERPEFDDIKVSPLLLIAKALLAVVRRYPELNSSWDEDAGEIVIKRYVNLGIAAATKRGLVVPNIKDAQELGLPELGEALKRLTKAARKGKSSLADLTGGTVTITNIGVFGVDTGTPILNPGEAAILGVGQIRDMPWVHDGELAVRKVTTFSLSFDHRLVDGEQGSKALRDLGEMLHDPLTMLAWG